MQEFAEPSSYGDDQAVDLATAWVARFAPLVMDDPSLTPADLRKQIRTAEELKSEAATLQPKLNMVVSSKHSELRATFEKASKQLDSVESDLRKRLAKLAPGDPDSLPDLDALQDRLAEREARQEMGLSTDAPGVLEAEVSGSNYAAAGFMGIFAAGWLSFTTLHAAFMISGMYKAFGIAALALLLFYAIFWAVGIGMAAGALAAASRESIELSGTILIVRRKLFGKVWEKKFELSPSSRAEIGMSSSTSMQSGRQRVSPSILITDVNGRVVTFGSNSTPKIREQLVSRINQYLSSQPG